MLGKGLESLIPKNNTQGRGADDNNTRPPGERPLSQPPAQYQPASSPIQPVHSQPQPRPSFVPPVQPVTQLPDRQSEPIRMEQRPQPVAQPVHRQCSRKSATTSRRNPSIISRSKRSRRIRTSRAGILTRTHCMSLRVRYESSASFSRSWFRKMEKETATGIAVEYQIIAGERRFMAAKLLGLPRVPAIVRNINLEREKLELGVIENIQRENLNPIEMARAFQRLQEEFRMTQREIAAKLGKSREVVANAVRLLDLPEYVQRAVEDGQLSESNARLADRDRRSGRAEGDARRYHSEQAHHARCERAHPARRGRCGRGSGRRTAPRPAAAATGPPRAGSEGHAG
jgi:hypothetical protein